MSWNKSVTAEAVVQRLQETQGLYSYCNRSYDGFVEKGATSVRRPKLPTLVVKKNTGTASNSADRKKTKTDTIMVETELDVYAVPILDEIAGKFESNDLLRNEFVISAGGQLQEQFDADVIVAAQTTTQVQNMAGSTLSWDDITLISKVFNQNKVPKQNRIVVVSANLEQEFWNLDVIKNAASYNLVTLSSGKFVEVMGMRFFISGLVPQITGKDNIVGIYGPGLAFILSRFVEIKETYDPELLADAIDLLAHAAAELDDDKFAVVVKKV